VPYFKTSRKLILRELSSLSRETGISAGEQQESTHRVHEVSTAWFYNFYTTQKLHNLSVIIQVRSICLYFYSLYNIYNSHII
jgi:hypothetical protein